MSIKHLDEVDCYYGANCVQMKDRKETIPMAATFLPQYFEASMLTPVSQPENRILCIGSELADVEASSFTQVSPHNSPVPSITFIFPPANFTIIDPPTKLGEGYLLLATGLGKVDFDKFLEVNSQITGEFWWTDENLRFEYSNNTGIHCSSAVAMDDALVIYDRYLSNLTGRGKLFTQHRKSRVVSRTDLVSPDFSWRNVGRLHLDCIIVGEISHSQDLEIVHLKVADYLRRFPNILAVIVIDVMYPVIDNVHDPQNGRMTAFYYDSTFPYNEHTPTGMLHLFAPTSGVSFGNAMLSLADCNHVIQATNINPDNLTGNLHNTPQPCNTSNMVDFSLRIPGSVMLVAEPGDPNSILGTPLNALPATYDFLIDLYRVKRMVITQALPYMNTCLAAAAAAAGPVLPVPDAPAVAQPLPLQIAQQAVDVTPVPPVPAAPLAGRPTRTAKSSRDDLNYIYFPNKR